MCLRDRMESLPQRPHVPPKPEAFTVSSYTGKGCLFKKKSLIILIFKSFIKHRMTETAVNEDAMF